ncbi:hypothetical protein LCGC14_2148660 [marine sediment metagenome]|uniref:Uncharacterized protein n=1 Tax=marine sediment metagenome TaxID=412755 RepID=A0A0F9GSF2_9ZZZZ
MAEFIPSISFTEFHKLKPAQLTRLKCAEITVNGEYVFSFINGNIEPSGFLRTQSEYRGSEANAVGGETLEEILREVVPV